jgi:hypothetical protein
MPMPRERSLNLSLSCYHLAGFHGIYAPLRVCWTSRRSISSSPVSQLRYANYNTIHPSSPCFPSSAPPPHAHTLHLKILSSTKMPEHPNTSTFSAASQAINGRARKRRRCMSRFNRKGGDEGEGSDEEEEEQEEERHIRHPKQTWTVVGQLRVTLFRPWMIPLPLIPAGFIVKYLNMSPATIFGVNFIAILPLGNLITLVTNELILRSSGHQAMVIIVTFQ